MDERRESPEFGYGDVMQLFWGDSPEQVLPMLIQDGRAAVTLSGGAGAADQPAAWLICWPASEYGLGAFVVADEVNGQNEFLAAWPVVETGERHSLNIDKVHADSDCDLIRMFECSVGERRFDVFDTYCTGALEGIAPGDVREANIHGWAIVIERAPVEPIILTPEQVSPDMRELYRKEFARDGYVAIEARQLSAMLPHHGVASPLWEFQGTVKSVRQGPVLLGLTFLILTVTVGDTEDGDFDLEISVTSETWAGDDPIIGQPVRGLAWLQASFYRNKTAEA